MPPSSTAQNAASDAAQGVTFTFEVTADYGADAATMAGHYAIAPDMAAQMQHLEQLAAVGAQQAAAAAQVAAQQASAATIQFGAMGAQATGAAQVATQHGAQAAQLAAQHGAQAADLAMQHGQQAAQIAAQHGQQAAAGGAQLAQHAGAAVAPYAQQAVQQGQYAAQQIGAAAAPYAQQAIQGGQQFAQQAGAAAAPYAQQAVQGGQQFAQQAGAAAAPYAQQAVQGGQQFAQQAGAAAAPYAQQALHTGQQYAQQVGHQAVQGVPSGGQVQHAAGQAARSVEQGAAAAVDAARNVDAQDIVDAVEDADFNMGNAGQTVGEMAQQLFERMREDPDSTLNVLARVVSPERVARQITGGTAKPDVKTAFQSADALAHRKEVRRVRGKRASATARLCAAPGCEEVHFSAGKYCAQHAKIAERKRRARVQQQQQSLEQDDQRKEHLETIAQADPHEVSKLTLREEMELEFTRAHKPTPEFIHAATVVLQEANEELRGLVSDVEAGLLYHQFVLLDVNGDGRIDAADMRDVLRRVDLDAAMRARDRELSDMISDASVEGLPYIDFPQYVESLLLLREAEEEVGCDYEEIRTAFWDLRAALMLHVREHMHGWVLKRGHFLIHEKYNPWKRRYLVETDNTLQYWEGQPILPGVDPRPGIENALSECPDRVMMRGEIPLLEIMHVDFSPKTVVPRQKDLLRTGVDLDDLVVFKITSLNGRRYTLAAPRSMAVKWVAHLSWHVSFSRAAHAWRLRFGSGVRDTMRIKDALETAVAVGQMLGDDADAEDIIEEVGSIDKSVVEGVVGSVAVGRAAFQQADKATGGGLGKFVRGAKATLKASAFAYCYARSVKNEMRSQTFGVMWEPKHEARSCACCKMVFKSLSARKTMKPHHCCSCGRCCCHGCSAAKLFYSATGRMERTCVQCIERGGPPLDRVLARSDKVDENGIRIPLSEAELRDEEVLAQHQEEEEELEDSDLDDDDDEADLQKYEFEEEEEEGQGQAHGKDGPAAQPLLTLNPNADGQASSSTVASTQPLLTLNPVAAAAAAAAAPAAGTTRTPPSAGATGTPALLTLNPAATATTATADNTGAPALLTLNPGATPPAAPSGR